jgi:hypothetical protein
LGRGKRLERVIPLTERGEKYWVGLLIGEINRKLKLGLAMAVSFGRTLSVVKRVGEDVGKILLLPSVLAMLTRRRLDSSVFYVLEKSGAMILPGASQDGIYHVLGKVVVENLLETVEPVLKMRAYLLTFLVCPMIRYVEACCSAHDALSEAERRVEGERQLTQFRWASNGEVIHGPKRGFSLVACHHGYFFS